MESLPGVDGAHIFFQIHTCTSISYFLHFFTLLLLQLFFSCNTLRFPQKIEKIAFALHAYILGRHFTTMTLTANYVIKKSLINKPIPPCKNSGPNGHFGTPLCSLGFLVAELFGAQIVCSAYFEIYIVRDNTDSKIVYRKYLTIQGENAFCGH